MSDYEPLSILSNHCGKHLTRLTPQGCLACENEKLQGRIAELEYDNKHLREDCVRLRRELDDGNGEIR